MMVDVSFTPEGALDRAHDLLRNVVAELIAARRSTKAAGLKPRMMTASGGLFHERLLGFDTFRAFLDDAERRGVVTLRPVPGPDLEVSLPDLATTPEPATTIRNDVYVAFAEWNEGCVAVWDRRDRRAYRFSADGSAPTGDGGDAGERYASDPDSFVRIEPLRPDEVHGWMQAFAEARSDATTRALLLDALTRDRPLNAFVRAVDTLGQQGEWRRFRLARLRERIETWAMEREVELDESVFAATPAVPAFRRPRPPTQEIGAPPPQPVAAQHHGDVERLRAFVKHAVERMTLAELAALPIAAQHFIEP